MSFLSGLSNIFHSIGHVLAGGDAQDTTDEQKKKLLQQQQQNAMSQNVAGPKPVQNNAPQLPPSVNLNVTPLQKANPNLGPIKVGSYDPNAPLVKAAAAQAAQPQAPEDKNSIGYKVTHNPVTDLVGSIVKPTAEMGNALLHVPKAVYREIQNKPIDDIQKEVYGTTDSGKIAKKIVGDTVSTGLLAAAPGIDGAIEGAASKVIPDTVGSTLTKLIPKTASGALQGGAFGANATASNGGSLKQTAESFAQNAAIGGAAGGFFAGIPILAKAVKDGHITPQAAEDATKVSEGVHTVNPNRPTDAAEQLGAPPAEPLAPGEPNGVASSRGGVQAEPAPAPVEAAPAPAQPPVEPAPVEAAPAQPAPAPSGKKATAENAPGIRQAAAKKLDSLGGNAGDPTTHDVFTNQELLAAGKAHADTFNDTQLVNQYKNGFTPSNAADIAKGHAALERLNEIAKADPTNKNAAKAIDNILQGAEQGFSGGGRTVNYAQQFYDGLKGPAKTSYLIREIDKVREAAGLPLLRDNEDSMLAATKTVEAHVNAEEATKGKIATLEQRLEEIKAEAQAGNGSKELTKEANDINGAIKTNQLALSQNTADLAKFYDTVAPRKVATQTKLGDLGRSLMLTSIAGRGNDIATTAVNSGHQLLQQTLEATAGKLVKGNAGKVIDTLPSPSAIGRGIKFGLQKSKARFQGNVAAGDASALLKKADTGSGKGGLLSQTDGTRFSKITAPIHRVVRSATEIATDLSEGMKESRIQQLAAQQGKQLGLEGHDLKTYTAATTASPSKAMSDAGTQLRDEVNNMHDNKITEGLSKFSNAAASIPVVGEQLKNLTLPFSRWTGGQLHNAIIDKNALVNVGQLIKAAIKGDTQGAITAASKVGVNGVGAIGAGYALAKAGLLTHQNAQGYNDDGVYLHVGGRYIPATFLGFFAPGIILGSAAHDAMQKNGGGKGSLLQTVVDTASQDLKNSYLAYSGQSLTGTSNPVLTSLKNAGKTGYGDVLATIGGQVAGQYIPAATGDVNAVLNNQLGDMNNPFNGKPLNPTHEAALTKVEKGASGVTTKKGKLSTAKDVTASTVNQLLNKVPFASQNLPRNKGVAANDEFDRLTRGSRDTTAEIKARADAKTAQEVAADFAKRGIPDPNATYKTGDSFENAVENRVENKKYDAAIEGLNAKLTAVKASPDVTSKQTDPIEKQIKTIQVLKQGNYDPKIRDTYSGTSLEEWRAMGDPTSDSYDKAAYEELYNYDKALAAAGVSSSKKDGSTPKYSLKDTSKSSARAASKAITSNTLGSTPGFATVDLSNLSPKKISSGAAQIPTIQQVKPGELIKKRAISVSKTR